jgi:hypothetical protein
MKEEKMMPSDAFCVAALMVEMVIADLEKEPDLNILRDLSATLRKMEKVRRMRERLEELDSDSPSG